MPAQDHNFATVRYGRRITWPQARENPLGGRAQQRITRRLAVSAVGADGFLDTDRACAKPQPSRSTLSDVLAPTLARARPQQ